jgi:L-lactate dehydrogenase complex protein LldG
MSEVVDAFVAAAAASGAHVHRDVDPAEIVAGRNQDEVGVSHAVYGLADTGSVVLAAGPDEPRARSLLPPVHVTVLEAGRILPGLPELFRELRGELPSALAIVTGPSRSADIEQKLVIGVHGPGEVHIVVQSNRGNPQVPSTGTDPLEGG